MFDQTSDLLKTIAVVSGPLLLLLGSIFAYKRMDWKQDRNPLGADSMSAIGATFASRDGVIQQLEANDRYTLAMRAQTMAIEHQTEALDRGEQAADRRAKIVADAAIRSAEALESLRRVGEDIKAILERR